MTRQYKDAISSEHSKPIGIIESILLIFIWVLLALLGMRPKE